MSWHRSKSVPFPPVKLLWGKSTQSSLLLSSALLLSFKWSSASDFITATLFIVKHKEFSSVNRCISRLPDVSRSNKFPSWAKWCRDYLKKRVKKMFLAPLSVLCGAVAEQIWWWQTLTREKCLKSQWMLSGLVELRVESSNNLLLSRPLALLPSNHLSGELCEERLAEQRAPVAPQQYEKYCTCKNNSKCGH